MSETQPDYDYERIQEENETARVIYDGVNFIRGWGDEGRRVAIVDRDCDQCGYDRQVRTHRVHGELPDTYDYECQRPGCPNYHGGSVGVRL